MVRLKKDIVIKAGTVFDRAPAITKRGSNAFECIIGLTKNSAGSFVYYMEPSDSDLKEWFEEV